MSNSHDEEVEQANREYLEAVDELQQLAPRARRFVPGEKIDWELWNEERFKKLREAEAKVAETDKKLEEAVRRWRSERQSSQIRG